LLVNKAYKFRIYPNKEQAILINKTIGCSRFVFNHFLANWNETYKETGKGLSYNTCSKQLPPLKKKYEWLKEVDSIAIQTSVKYLSESFNRFFKKQNKAPHFKYKKNRVQSYTTKHTNGNIAIVDNKIKLPKLGLVKFAKSRDVEGRILNATVQFSIIWWLTDTTGGSPLVLTVAGLAGFLPQALVGPFAGTITDRYSRKLMMILADMTVALGSLLLFTTMYFNEPSILLVKFVLVVRSLAMAFHMPAMQASVPLLAPEEHLTKVAGWGQTVSSTSNIAGPAVGLVLLAVSSLEWVLLLDVFGAVIASSILLFIHIPRVPRKEEEVF